MYAQLHLCTYSVSPVFVKGKLFNTFLSVSGNLIAKLIGYFLCRSIFFLTDPKGSDICPYKFCTRYLLPTRQLSTAQGVFGFGF